MPILLPNALIILDERDRDVLPAVRQAPPWKLSWISLKYPEIFDRIGEIRGIVEAEGIEIVIYGRNDQIEERINIGAVTRILRTGYTSFSGIDRRNRAGQMAQCFADLLGGEPVDIRGEESAAGAPAPDPPDPARGNVSLLFDTEQLGGVRYGLPRILRLLAAYGARATFFATNLVGRIYPGIIGRIREEGHELAIHGFHHEPMDGRSAAEQESAIRGMVQEFGGGIRGANFLGRMDAATIEALAASGISYFVYPLINKYRLVSYPRRTPRHTRIRAASGSIWALPVAVETYGSTWFSVRNMVDAALEDAGRRGIDHVSILCHPFRDGNLQHLRDMERLFRYLRARGLRAIPLAERVRALDAGEATGGADEEAIESWQPEGLSITSPRDARDIASLPAENLMHIWRKVRASRMPF